MNILPKKRWHVRTRENIARVRKDEQEAAAESEDKKQRILRAEKEARTALLRERAHSKYGVPERENEIKEQTSKSCPSPQNEKHVNFFEELEEGKIVLTKTNAETELEEKEKREKYEKQIGYLTYLGQDTVEATGNIPWYEKVPAHRSSSSSAKEEKCTKSKLLHDPLTVIRRYLPSETKKEKPSESSKQKSSILEYQSILKKKKQKKKKKHHKKKAKKRRKRDSSASSSSSSESDSDEEVKEAEKRKSLELLRAERLRREGEERLRTEALLNKIHGTATPEAKKEPTTPVVQQKYNSQYNPELAKQNYAKSPWDK